MAQDYISFNVNSQIAHLWYNTVIMFPQELTCLAFLQISMKGSDFLMLLPNFFLKYSSFLRASFTVRLCWTLTFVNSISRSFMALPVKDRVSKSCCRGRCVCGLSHQNLTVKLHVIASCLINFHIKLHVWFFSHQFVHTLSPTCDHILVVLILQQPKAGPHVSICNVQVQSYGWFCGWRYIPERFRQHLFFLWEKKKK